VDKLQGSNGETMPRRVMPGSTSIQPDQHNQEGALPDAQSLSELAATQCFREWEDWNIFQ
jgi:hypothetical protein